MKLLPTRQTVEVALPLERRNNYLFCDRTREKPLVLRGAFSCLAAVLYFGAVKLGKKSHPKFERTLVIIKPDGVQRSLIGEIIQRYERMGLKIVGLKMNVPSSELVEKHYTIDPNWRRLAGEKRLRAAAAVGEKLSTDDPVVIGEIVLQQLKRYLVSGPVVATVWQGANAVAVVRKITGGTEPLSSDVGTIRGDFVLDSYQTADTDGRAVRNLIHVSSSTMEAEKEIALWFSPEELINYRLVQEAILYDINLDGLLE